jgi:hypothetical protein
MTYDELLAEINFKIEYCTCEGWGNNCWEKENIPWRTLRAVVELHKPRDYKAGNWCVGCNADYEYPCPTIQAIEKELS